MTKKINLAVIGLGNRGCWVIENVLLKMPDVHVAAVCDVYEDRVAAMIKPWAAHWCSPPGKPTEKFPCLP